MNPRHRIYNLLMEDKYRRRKIQQDKAFELLPEWDHEESRFDSKSENLEFLNGRIDGLLYAWSNLTGWNYEQMARAIMETEDNPFWRADDWDWIDLSVVDRSENEIQCPWCGDIYRTEELLYIEPPEWTDEKRWLPVCDDCADPWLTREQVAAAEARRAEAYGGQLPLDAPKISGKD